MSALKALKETGYVEGQNVARISLGGGQNGCQRWRRIWFIREVAVIAANTPANLVAKAATILVRFP